MRFFIIAILGLFICFPARADVWVSPIDEKYKSQDPYLYEFLEQAKELIDDWNGQTELLVEADEILKEILNEDNEFAPAYKEYGRLYIKAGYLSGNQFKKNSLVASQRALLKAIEIEPKYADSYGLLGELYIYQKKYEDAKKALIQAEEIGTDNKWLQIFWSKFYREQRNYNKAIEHLENITKAPVDDKRAYAAALSGLSHIFIKLNEHDQADKVFKKLLEFEPNKAWNWGNYSSFLINHYYKVDAAIDAGRKAVNLMDYPFGRFILAKALYTKWAFLIQNPETKNQAAKYFDEAQDIFPNIQAMIEDTKGNRFTLITSRELSKLSKSNAR